LRLAGWEVGERSVYRITQEGQQTKWEPR
jgi:hypothetical protein